MADGEDEAARAFEDLRAEVSVLRRAVERLLAERAELSDTPDYSETLGIISHNLSGTAQRVDVLMNSPALSLTPETISQQIDAATYMARHENYRQFTAARQELEELGIKLGRYLRSHIVADEQRRRLWHASFVGLVVGVMVGMMVWAILPGPIARAMPSSWLWPEWMAARSLQMPMWEGGQRLMRAGSPDAFAGVLSGNRLTTANRDALDVCRKQAIKAKKPVRCTIQIRAKD